MGKIDSKEADAFAPKALKRLKDWTPPLHTITSDNEKEFAYHQTMAATLGIDYYFAKPYHSEKRRPMKI